MTIQLSSLSTSQSPLLAQLDQAGRADKDRGQQRQRELAERENRPESSANQDINYLEYTQKVVSRLAAPENPRNDSYRQDPGGARSQQALSAYAAQQQSLDREQLDSVRNMLGVDYYV